MKTIFRSSGAAVLISAVLGFAAANAAAQDACADVDAITAADAKVRENYPKIETRKVAVDAGKEYLEKYGTCDTTKDFVNWLKPLLPVWEKQVKDYEEYLWRKPRVDKFDGGIKASKFDDVYAAGAELVQRYPDNVNYQLPLGLIGLYESYKSNFKYNEDSIRYAKMAIAKLKSGSAEPKKDKDQKPIVDKDGKEVFGPYQFERNKDNAISELTYALAYINYHAKKDRKAGLPYYYEVSQMPGIYKEEPRLYATIASYYIDESDPIRKEIVALIEKQKIEPTDEGKEKLEVEIKAKVAMLNGYTERALDSFGRAYSFADEKIPAEKTLKADVYKTLQVLYQRRFEKTDGLDKWISAAAAKQLPNPTTAVTPISDPEPVATTTAPASTTVPAGPPTTGKPTTPTAKAATVNGKTASTTKPAAATTKPPAANAKVTKAKKPKRR